MDTQTLHRIADQYLRPFFSGAELSENFEASTAREKCVALKDPCTIAFKLKQADTERLILRRSQPFEGAKAEVGERRVVEAFLSVLLKLESAIGTSYEADILTTFQRRVVVEALFPHEAHQTGLAAIDQLAKWSTRLYEGRPVAASFGYVPGRPAVTGLDISKIAKEDFSAVLSNGYDTLLVLNDQGSLSSYETLEVPENTPVFAPYRQSAIANWAGGGRVALVLNRLGEILAFKDQKLIFARRSGQWHSLTHEPILTQISRPDDMDIRRAVYASCLDASFTRTGACVGIVTSGNKSKWQALVPRNEDRLADESSIKTRALARLINGKSFQNLDRRMRMEILAIDGATLIDYTGQILAAGAILKIPGGSESGGRRAAAKALSKLGVGIKVSADGGITGFLDEVDAPKFLIM